jgi:hypothetical protein
MGGPSTGRNRSRIVWLERCRPNWGLLKRSCQEAFRSCCTTLAATTGSSVNPLGKTVGGCGAFSPILLVCCRVRAPVQCLLSETNTDTHKPFAERDLRSRSLKWCCLVSLGNKNCRRPSDRTKACGSRVLGPGDYKPPPGTSAAATRTKQHVSTPDGRPSEESLLPLPCPRGITRLNRARETSGKIRSQATMGLPVATPPGPPATTAWYRQWSNEAQGGGADLKVEPWCGSLLRQQRRKVWEAENRNPCSPNGAPMIRATSRLVSGKWPAQF